MTRLALLIAALWLGHAIAAAPPRCGTVCTMTMEGW